jgi:cytoskeletal protein CcmA (bactofilin family)
MRKNQKKERMLWEGIGGIIVIITILFFTIVGIVFAVAPDILSSDGNAQSRFGGMWIAGGATVDVAETVDTDAFIGGNRVSINDTLEQDAFIAGFTVAINAPVQGALRAGGNTVIVNSEIEGNTLLMGDRVWIKEDARMRGTVNILASEVIIDGEVDSELAIAADAVTLNGIMRAPVEVNGQQITIADDARFAENATMNAYTIYTESGVLGTEYITYNQDTTILPSAKNDNTAFNSWLSLQLSSFFGSLIIGLLLILIAPRWVRHVGHSMHTKKKITWKYGAVFFLATPTALLLLAVTIIGLPLSLVGGFVYASLLMLGQLFAGMMLGLLMIRSGKEMHKEEQYNHRGRVMLQFTAGFAIISLFVSIPFLGWFIGLLASVWGAGGILVNYREWRERGDTA